MSTLCNKFILFILLTTRYSEPLTFNPNQFKDVTEICQASSGNPLHFILNEDRPAMYVAVDLDYQAYVDLHSSDQTHMDSQFSFDRKREFSVQDSENEDESGMTFRNELKIVRQTISSNTNGAKPFKIPSNNEAFDCVLHFETKAPTGNKTDRKYDALSLVVIEFDYIAKKKSSGVPETPLEYQSPGVEVMTFGHAGYSKRKITHKAQYSELYWHRKIYEAIFRSTGINYFDFRTNFDPQHIVKPDTLHSTFDKPASITVNLTNWSHCSFIYFTVTSFKLSKDGDHCENTKDFNCAQGSFLNPPQDHMCISQSLVCDGLPNCPRNYLPTEDEYCFTQNTSLISMFLVFFLMIAFAMYVSLKWVIQIMFQRSARQSQEEIPVRYYNRTRSLRPTANINILFGRPKRYPPTYDQSTRHGNPDRNHSKSQNPQARYETEGRSANLISEQKSFGGQSPPGYEP